MEKTHTLSNDRKLMLPCKYNGFPNQTNQWGVPAKKHTMFFPTIFKHPKNGSYTNLFISTNADLVISKWD